MQTAGLHEAIYVLQPPAEVSKGAARARALQHRDVTSAGLPTQASVQPCLGVLASISASAPPWTEPTPVTEHLPLCAGMPFLHYEDVEDRGLGLIPLTPGLAQRRMQVVVLGQRRDRAAVSVCLPRLRFCLLPALGSGRLALLTASQGLLSFLGLANDRHPEGTGEHGEDGSFLPLLSYSGATSPAFPTIAPVRPSSGSPGSLGFPWHHLLLLLLL